MHSDLLPATPVCVQLSSLCLWPRGVRASSSSGMSATTRFCLAPAIAALLLVGCATHPASSVAPLKQESSGRYEIKLVAAGWCAGGPCNFPQWPHREYVSHWIYSDTTNGVVPAERLTLSYGNETQYRWSQTALLGSVTFSDGHMQVALRVPIYADDGSIKHYERYELNGDYKLQP